MKPEWKNMAKWEYPQREVYFQRVGFFNAAFEKSHPPEQLFDNCSISSQPWQWLPSHTNKATVAGTRDEEEKGDIQEDREKMLQFSAQDTVELDGSFFQPLKKPQNKTK